MNTTLAELLSDLAHAAPRLPDAACRDHVALFDATSRRGRNERVRREALRVCATCPALAASCRSWLHSLDPDQRPFGVIAGEVVAVARPVVP